MRGGRRTSPADPRQGQRLRPSFRFVSPSARCGAPQTKGRVMGKSLERLAAMLAIAGGIAALNSNSARAQDGGTVLLPGIDITATRLTPGPNRRPLRRAPPADVTAPATEPGPGTPGETSGAPGGA